MALRDGQSHHDALAEMDAHMERVRVLAEAEVQDTAARGIGTGGIEAAVELVGEGVVAAMWAHATSSVEVQEKGCSESVTESASPHPMSASTHGASSPETPLGREAAEAHAHARLTPATQEEIARLGKEVQELRASREADRARINNLEALVGALTTTTRELATFGAAARAFMQKTCPAEFATSPF